MKTGKPNVDDFIHGGKPAVVVQPEPVNEPAPKKKAAKPATVVKGRKTEDVPAASVEKMVKFPLELPENVRKAVKRFVIDLDKVSMNEYMVQAIIEKLEKDGVEL